MDTEILHINELLSTDDHSLFSGGELHWDKLVQNSDGSLNLRLTLTADTGDTIPADFSLATMVVSERYGTSEPGLFTKEIFGQLMQGGESFF